jgi:hypothetical protein
MFYDRLLKKDRIKDKDQEFCALFNGFVNKHYQSDIQFFAYSEWLSFVEEVLREAEERRRMEEKDLEAALGRHRAAIAIHGELQDAYVASAKFVRLS